MTEAVVVKSEESIFCIIVYCMKTHNGLLGVRSSV